MGFDVTAALTWGGGASCAVSAVLALISLSKDRQSRQLLGLRQVEHLSELRELASLVPIVIAVTGRVWASRPLRCEQTDVDAAIVHLHEDRRFERRAAGIWVNDSEPLRSSVREADWALVDGAGNVLPVQRGRDAVGDCMETVADVFAPASDTVLTQLVGELSGRRTQGVRTRERALPIGATITAVGELVRAPGDRPPGDRGAIAVGRPGRVLISESGGGEAAGSAGAIAVGNAATGGSASGGGPFQAAPGADAGGGRGASWAAPGGAPGAKGGDPRGASGAPAPGVSAVASSGPSASPSTLSSHPVDLSHPSASPTSSPRLLLRAPSNGAPFLLSTRSVPEIAKALAAEAARCRGAAAVAGAVGVALLGAAAARAALARVRRARIERRAAAARRARKAAAARRLEARGIKPGLARRGAEDEDPDDDERSLSSEEEDIGGTVCAVCLSRSARLVFPGCGHLCVCARCAPNLQACPICRARSTPVKVFVV